MSKATSGVIPGLGEKLAGLLRTLQRLISARPSGTLSAWEGTNKQ